MKNKPEIETHLDDVTDNSAGLDTSAPFDLRHSSLYSIFDNATQTYKGLYVLQRDAEAKRMCVGILSGQVNDISRTPTDFIMFKIGYFDEYEGFVYACDIQPVVKFWELQAELRSESSPETSKDSEE
jgi:hypothetical protein